MLEAAAARDPAAVRLAEALADTVLAAEPVRLARAVLAGGPHMVSRGLELAALVLPDVEAGEASKSDAG